MPRINPSESNPSAELVRRLEHWRQNRSTIAAAEVCETAIVEGIPAEAIQPARFLLRSESGAATLVRGEAARLLQRLGSDEGGDDRDNQRLDESKTPVGYWRRATRFEPQDPFAWVELALAYITNGKDQSALRAMRVALQLAPYDRHVLRSASRLLLHSGDPEQAHDLLLKNPATRSDPWLMAGEIALSGFADRNPRFLKIGAEYVNNRRIRPRHLSELASAIGTVHLKEGIKKARKLFTTSLIDPTGNSLAQAEWATPRLGDLVKPSALEETEESLEARMFAAYWKDDFPTVVRLCEAWSLDEPYSSRPLHFGSGAAIAIDDLPAAQCFCETGLHRQPDDFVLKNNLSYVLIANANLTEGYKLNESCLRRPDLNAIATATRGFYYTRTGNFEQGKAAYREAIAKLRAAGNIGAETLARAYFAMEAVRAEFPEAAQLLAEAKDALKIAKHVREAAAIIRRAENWIEAARHRKGEKSLLQI
jgi:Flp pilus assembly protein TadD